MTICTDGVLTESTMDRIPDIDPQETREWLEALDGVLAAKGPIARIS